jgi:hypothetical protein
MVCAPFLERRILARVIDIESARHHYKAASPMDFHSDWATGRFGRSAIAGLSPCSGMDWSRQTFGRA